MAQKDPLNQALTVAEDLRASVSDTVDSLLSQGAAQLRRASPELPARLPGDPSPELPKRFPELPEIGKLPELPELPELPKAEGSPTETGGETGKETVGRRRAKGQVEGF